MSTVSGQILYSVEEAAQRMGVSAREIRRLMNEGKIDYFRIGKKQSRVRIPKFALEEYARKEILIQTAQRQKKSK